MLSLCLIKHHAMKKVELHAFLTSELDGASRAGRFTLGDGALFPLDRSLGEAQSRSGRWGRKRRISYLCRKLNRDFSDGFPVV
jgi:hypothetical protein